MGFRASLETICNVIIYTNRCKSGKVSFLKENEVSLKLATGIPRPLSSIYSIYFNNDAQRTLVDLYSNTPYCDVISVAVNKLFESNSSALDGSDINVVKFYIDQNNYLVDERFKAPFRYRVGVGLIVNGNPKEFYSEYVEDLGWTIFNNLEFNTAISNLLDNPDMRGFVKPIVELASIPYNEDLMKFESPGVIYNLRDMLAQVRILDLNEGSLIEIPDSSNDNTEPTSVLVPFKFLNTTEVFKGNLAELVLNIQDVNGVDTYCSIRRVRASSTLIAKLLTFLYLEDYYQEIVQLCIPRKFERSDWKFSRQFLYNLSPSSIYGHVIGVDVIIEFNSILDIPSDRLSKLGLSAHQVIKSARDAYNWICSLGYCANWNQPLQKSIKLIDSVEIPFNSKKYNLSFNFTQLDALSYFILCVQKYLLFVQMKLLASTERHENNCVISMPLGFSYLMESAVKHFQKEQLARPDLDKFFSERSVTLNGNNVSISGLTGKVSIMSTNDIYMKWVDISNSRLVGNKVVYDEITVYRINDVADTYSDIVDFILSDLIKIFPYTTKEFINSQFPIIIEKIDMRSIYNIATDTSNINHKRLCVEFCKFYCGFYGNELLLEIN